uniref:Uncharacterized protein n=1 Tax=Chrysemys picta bellii TaxID=8478 RepID=A0A8C3FGB5_CHRPI
MKRLLQRRTSPRRDPPGPPAPRAEPHEGPKAGGEERPKRGRGFPFKGVLRRKGPSREETEPPPRPSAPPNSLPVTPCYCTDTLSAQPDSPPLGKRPTGSGSQACVSPPAPPEPASETHKELVIQRLVALLEEQAGVINDEVPTRCPLSRPAAQPCPNPSNPAGAPSPTPQPLQLAGGGVSLPRTGTRASSEVAGPGSDGPASVSAWGRGSGFD